MTNSDFWRGLAEKFRAVSDPSGFLGAHWRSEKGSPFEWSIQATKVVHGGFSARSQFESLAARGGARVDNPNRRDLLSAWLDALNKDLPSDDFDSGGEIISGKPSVIWGSIRRICDASATFCSILERRALDAEAAAAVERIGEPRINDEATAVAIRLFESHPDFPRVQVQMREQMEEAARNSPADAVRLGSKARMQYALIRFDIRAGAFLDLVLDIGAQNAFIFMLESFERAAWQEYTGFPIEAMRPASAQADADLEAIHSKFQEWIGRGYRRLASLHEERQPAANSGTQLARPTSQPGNAVPAQVFDQGAKGLASVAQERYTLLAAFKAEGRRFGIKINDAMVAKAASQGKWNDRTMVAWWKRNDAKCKPSHDRMIRGVLAKDPRSIWH